MDTDGLTTEQIKQKLIDDGIDVGELLNKCFELINSKMIEFEDNANAQL